MLTVIDLDGKPIQVTDLKAAIKQAKTFADYTWMDKSQPPPAFFKKQQRYWQHLLRQLKKL